MKQQIQYQSSCILLFFQLHLARLCRIDILLQQVFVQERRIIRHDPASSVFQCPLEVVLGVADPEISHDASFAKVIAEESHQRVEQLECLEKEMHFPVVSPLSDFPLVGLLGPKWYLHGMLLDIDVGQQSKDHGNKVEEKLFIPHEGHDLSIDLSQSILMLISYSKDSNMLPLVASYHFGNFFDGCSTRSFQFDVHWDPWKQSKDFLQGRDPLSFRSHSHSKRSEVQFNLFLERREVFEVQISYKGLQSTRPLEVVVMMHNKNSIFCLADIHFEHIAVFGGFLKGFNGIFCVFAWSAPMGNFQHPLSKESFHKNQGFRVSMRFVEEGGEEEKDPAHNQIPTQHQHQRYQDHRMVFIKQRARPKMSLLYIDQMAALL